MHWLAVFPAETFFVEVVFSLALENDVQRSVDEMFCRGQDVVFVVVVVVFCKVVKKFGRFGRFENYQARNVDLLVGMSKSAARSVSNDVADRQQLGRHYCE